MSDASAACASAQARLTRELTDGTRDYDSLYRCIYRALRASEASGRISRVYRVWLRIPFAWGEETTAPAGYGRPAFTWQLTTVGTSHLTAWHDSQSAPPGARAEPSRQRAPTLRP